MADKSLIYNEADGTFDIGYDENGRVITDDLETQIYLALFSNARATRSEISKAELREGFWGEIFGDTHGSKLWLNNGLKTRENLNSLIDYAKKSLDFLVDLQKLNNVAVDGFFTSNGATLEITLTYLTNERKVIKLEV